MPPIRQSSDVAHWYRTTRHAAGLHRESNADSDFYARCRCGWAEGPYTVGEAGEAIDRHLRETAEEG